MAFIWLLWLFSQCVCREMFFFVIGVLGVLSCVGVVMNNFKSVIMSNERNGVLCPHAYTIYFFKNQGVICMTTLRFKRRFMRIIATLYRSTRRTLPAIGEQRKTLTMMYEMKFFYYSYYMNEILLFHHASTASTDISLELSCRLPKPDICLNQEYSTVA